MIYQDSHWQKITIVGIHIKFGYFSYESGSGYTSKLASDLSMQDQKLKNNCWNNLLRVRVTIQSKVVILIWIKYTIYIYTGWPRNYRKFVLLFCATVLGKLRNLQYIFVVTYGPPSVYIYIFKYNPSKWIVILMIFHKF